MGTLLVALAALGGGMDLVDYANADETALQSFERCAPDMPWEISTGKSVLIGELTIYPAPHQPHPRTSRCRCISSP